MHPSAIFILSPREVSIDSIVCALFKGGYGIAAFGDTYMLVDDRSPSSLFGLRLYSNIVVKAQDIRTKVATILTENKIPYFAIIVGSSQNSIDFAWIGSNLATGESDKRKSVSYLRLVKSVSEENDPEAENVPNE